MTWGARVREAWNGPRGLAFRRLGRGLGRAYLRILAVLVGQVRVAWARSGGRARVAVLLVGLILLGAETRSTLPSVSDIAQALAVLLVAGIGFWMILTAPIRRRR